MANNGSKHPPVVRKHIWFVIAAILALPMAAFGQSPPVNENISPEAWVLIGLLTICTIAIVGLAATSIFARIQSRRDDHPRP